MQYFYMQCTMQFVFSDILHKYPQIYIFLEQLCHRKIVVQLVIKHTDIDTIVGNYVVAQ